MFNMGLAATGLQDETLSRIPAGEFHIVVIAHHCPGWSRAQFNGLPGPKPASDRRPRLSDR